ncbi:hypothetical protein [Planctomyces sp. SH-PL62]|uniref:hypothetical protein n=1 Tax=Planctomyces sp. SH-PL62 TaxID=1636152 RepID=UPI00078C1416|nr:hypothetical protein [Planctomyces sp. SH-PL62]AMV36816.1 hypothetical protein VT85_05250 [Planctomyces sp. SH-PL62]
MAEQRDETTWRRSGDAWVIGWGGDDWTLGFVDGRYGLRGGRGGGERLVLRGLAATGRRDGHVFTPESLVGVESFHSRVLATFEPAGWNGLTVRAAWGPCRDGRGLDLEVQASTSTVGELRRMEVLVGTRSGPDGARERRRFVTARDRASAGMSYDGRETAETLAVLETLPVAGPGRPLLFQPTDSPSAYLEFVHPEDFSRVVVETVEGTATDVEYALFGYDLEKGVVLRGRLRGVWLPGATTPEAADEECRLFLHEPPPLRTS